MGDDERPKLINLVELDVEPKYASITYELNEPEVLNKSEDQIRARSVGKLKTMIAKTLADSLKASDIYLDYLELPSRYPLKGATRSSIRCTVFFWTKILPARPDPDLLENRKISVRLPEAPTETLLTKLKRKKFKKSERKIII